MNARAEPDVGYVELPKLDPAVEREIEAVWWPLSRLGEGLQELARRSGLAGRDAADLTPPPAALPDDDEIAAMEHWFGWASGQLGIEVQGVDAAVPDTAQVLRRACPAVMLHWSAQGRGFLLLLSGRGGRLRVLGPDLKVRTCSLERVRAARCWADEAPLEPQIARLLDLAGVSGPRRAGIRAGLLRDRLARERIGGLWMLRQAPSAGVWRQLVEARVPGKLAGVLAVFALVYALEAVGWAMIGGAALKGRLDFGWLAAWLLLVLTLVPWRLAGTWLEGLFALDTARIVKSRLLAGALAMDAEQVTRQGAGALIGRVMEAQALESLALNGGMAVVVGALELMVAAWVLAHGAGGRAQLTLLSAALVLTAWFAWRYGRAFLAWSLERLTLTNHLIEGMVGHRTRLAQERPGRRDVAEDKALRGYLDTSRAMDRAGVVVLAGLPSGWVLLALAGLVPAFTSGRGLSPVALAISLGGMLLAQRALAGISGGLAALTRALVAWRQVAPLIGRTSAPQPRPFLPARQLSHPGGRAPLVGAHGVVFRYQPEGEAVIEDAHFRIEPGERILLEGASGGGKSTLAALLTGLRTPQSGLLLLNGLDRHTLGEDWRRLVTAAPQFHENHILSGPLAFNLLMGRGWPAGEADLAEAEALCEELGLGDLLRRMPAGILQRVGETGWQLSHGERSRIFLARALLQNAELTILDESFGALDPETLEQCLRTTLRRARALLVIAHP